MYYKEKGAIKVAFSIRLTDEEKKLADSYAKVHGISTGEAFKNALFERIEEEYDLVIAEEAYQDYINNGRKSTSIGDFWSELDEGI